jgi:hypothetical protein
LCYEIAGLILDISTYEGYETGKKLQCINFLFIRLFIHNIPKQRNVYVTGQGRSDAQLSVTKFNPCEIKV